MTTAGTIRNTVPGRPKATTSTVTSAGPRAKPAVPPSENTLMPVALRSPETAETKRAPSGWKAATPSPLSSTAATRAA